MLVIKDMQLHILFDTKIENLQRCLVPYILIPHSEIWNRYVNIDEETQM